MVIKGASLAQVQEIAESIGVTLHNVRQEGNAVACVLRPMKGSEKFRLISRSRVAGSADRRVWAVCWHGHYSFFYALLKEFPGVSVTTCRARYTSLQDFLTKAAGTDVPRDPSGSIRYSNLCDCSKA